MNLSLFKSLWAVTAILLCAGFWAWMVMIDAAPGAGEGSDVNLVLASGWTTLAIMIGVCFYSLRKFVHKLGWSPEFKLRVPIEQLEEAEQQLNEVRRRILLGQLSDAKSIESEAESILRSCGVFKVCRAVVDKQPGRNPEFVISVQPTEPLGRMSKWLHFHVYLGLASGVLLFIHGGASLGTPMGVLMNVLTAVVLITGVVGTFLFALGPKWMTRAERDMNYEEAFVLERSLREKIAQAYEQLSPEQVQKFKSAERSANTAVLERTALMQVIETEPESREELAEVMVLVSQRKRILKDLRGAARVKFMINIWRAIHIPASIVLIAVSLVHVWSILRW